MTTSFVHLRLHSEYSLTDGLIRLKALTQKAVEVGQPALAVTDETNLFGLVKIYKQAQGQGSSRSWAAMSGFITLRIRLIPTA